MCANNPHITFDTLDKYLQKTLTEDEIFAVEYHLGGCAVCAARVGVLRFFDFALQKWNTKTHGEAYRAYQDAIRSMWILSSSGIMQLRPEIQTQIFRGIATVSLLAFLGHRRLKRKHLDTHIEIDEYKIRFSDDAGLMKIVRIPSVTKPDYCTVSVTPEITLPDLHQERVHLELYQFAGMETPEEENTLVWKDTTINFTPIEIPNLTLVNQYKIRASCRGRLWEMPLPLRVP